MPATIDYLQSLILARDHFILSLHTNVNATFNPSVLESQLVSVSLGPHPVSIEDADLVRGAWTGEFVATQHLIFSLDAFRENLLDVNSDFNDLCAFLKCLRTAFSQNTYSPTWCLTGDVTQEFYRITDDWEIDLRNRHETEVKEEDYRHASGLLRLTDLIRNLSPYKTVSQHISARHFSVND